MIEPSQIPDEVFEAFQKAWAVTSTLSTKECLAAALNAWPGMWVEQLYPLPVDTQGIILPLPQEVSDD